MAKLAGRSRFGERRFAETGDSGRFACIEDLIEVCGGSLWVETSIAGELEAKVLFADPDLAAVVAGKVVALVQMVWLAAGVALRDHVRREFLAADGA